MLFPEPIIVLDTETTGTSNRAEIIEARCSLPQSRRSRGQLIFVLNSAQGHGSIHRQSPCCQQHPAFRFVKRQAMGNRGPYFVQWMNAIPTPLAHR